MRIRVTDQDCACGERKNPREYMECFKQARPVYMPVIGYPSVGKTIWLMSVSRMLQQIAAYSWQGFMPTPLDSFTREFYRQVEAQPHLPKPEPTNKDRSDNYLYLLKNMPLWSSRTWVMRDLAGEHFSSVDLEDKDVLELVCRCRAAMFFFSLAEMRDADHAGQTMKDMLLNYVAAIQNTGRDIRAEKRRVLVVLTKADGFSKDLGVPQHFLQHVAADPISQAIEQRKKLPMGPAEMQEYCRQMEAFSDQVAEWVRQSPDGANFLNYAEDRRITVRFTMVSNCANDKMNGDPKQPMGEFWFPRRAMDPLFWSLEFHSARS